MKLAPNLKKFENCQRHSKENRLYVFHFICTSRFKKLWRDEKITSPILRYLETLQILYFLWGFFEEQTIWKEVENGHKRFSFRHWQFSILLQWALTSHRYSINTKENFHFSFWLRVYHILPFCILCNDEDDIMAY